MEEVKQMEFRGVTRRPGWIPRSQKIDVGKEKNVSHDVSLILSTVENEKTEVDKIRSSGRKTTRGRKKQELPEDLIRELANKGMGSKRIAAKLLTDRGIRANYRTIARIIAGQRVMI